MKNYSSLIALINKLNQEEKKSLVKYLKYYSNRSDFSKSEKLLKIISKNHNFNIIDIQFQLYGKVNEIAFKKLVERLKDKTLEVLIFNSNISKKYYTDRVRVIFELKKKLIQCDILSLKGLRDDGDFLCKKIISKAEQYELFDILMSALIIRQRFINIRKNSKVVKQIQERIQETENKQKAVLNTQLIYNSLINKINNSTDFNSYYNELKLSIKKIEVDNNLFISDLISYYLNYLKTELYQIEGNYVDANICLELIDNLVKKKSIYSDNRMGTTLLNMSNNNLFLKKFDVAVYYAKKAVEYFPNNIFNKSLVNEYLFYSFFYQNKFEESKSVINQIVNLPSANNILFTLDKWNYLSAALDFKLRDFQISLNKLQSIIEFDKDKEGWNINKRILIIMCRIELGEFESVDLQVQNLEKFIKRSIKKRDIRLRYIYILRLFIKLINSDYNFNYLYTKRIKYFEILDNGNSNLKWNIKSPEIIKIDDWFKSKVNRSIHSHII
jgi:hypothetical protein